MGILRSLEILLGGELLDITFIGADKRAFRVEMGRFLDTIMKAYELHGAGAPEAMRIILRREVPLDPFEEAARRLLVRL